jgi:hypothetical protein
MSTPESADFTSASKRVFRLSVAITLRILTVFFEGSLADNLFRLSSLN